MSCAALSDYAALTKPGITRHVMMVAAAGFVAGHTGSLDWPLLMTLVTGAALVSGGTNGLNQWWERDVDARMPRTQRRPVASGRIAPAAAFSFSLGIGVLGVALLAWRINLLTAALAALTLVSYVLAYTPLKKRSTLNTLVGCVPGALPVLGGWTAATGRADPGAWALFAVLFLWQLPHTLALAWVYRKDYLAGGLVMPGGDDAKGRVTAAKAGLYALLLTAASLAPVALGLAGTAYAAVALATGGALVALSAGWLAAPSPKRAYRVFVASLVYLPLVLGAVVVGRY